MSETEAKSKVILRAVNDDTLRTAVRECMEFCDWRAIVAPGATVVVKPNLCAADPEKWAMSNTDPRITHAVCELLMERAGKVYVVESDLLRQTAWEAFEVSGCRPLEKLGVTLVNMSEGEQVEVKLDSCPRVKLPKIMLDADVFITLPVLKTHALTYFTGSIKNQWGCVPQYDRILLHQYLDPMLAELHGIFKPRISIMDGIIGMEGRGPANGKPRRLDLILASQDSVALDATAMRLVGLEVERCRHLIQTGKRGLGRWKAEEITIDGDFAAHQTKFEPAIKDIAIGAMNYMTRYRWFVKHLLEKDTIFYPVRALVQLLRRIGVVEGG